MKKKDNTAAPATLIPDSIVQDWMTEFDKLYFQQTKNNPQFGTKTVLYNDSRIDIHEFLKAKSSEFAQPQKQK